MQEKDPYGIESLAIEARVSASTITKLKAGTIPARKITRELIASALGLTENDLFPIVGAS